MANKSQLLGINEFLNSYKAKSQQSVLNGEYYQFEGDNRAPNTKFMDSRFQAEKQYFVDYTKRAKEKELTISHLFDTLDNKARANGLQLYFRESGRKDNTWDVYYVPTEDYQQKILGQQQEQIEEYLDSVAKFNFSGVDTDGLININGQKVINQLLKDRVDEETVIITMLEKQLLEQNRLFDIKKNGKKTAFLQNLEKLHNTQDVKEREKLIKKSKNSVSFVDKSVKEGGVASSNFRGLKDEFMKARQGIGSSKSLAIRQGFINQKPFIDRIIEQNYAAINKYQKQFNGLREVTYNKAKEGMAHDIMQIFAMYAQATDATNIEKEIGQLQNYNYLKNTNLLKLIQEEGRAINKSRPYIGTSQEGSIDNFLLSYFKSSDIDFLGSLDDKTNRKRVQTTNTLERTKAAKDLLKKNTKQRKIYTKADSILGFTNSDDEFNRMYSEVFVSQDEIYKALKDLGETEVLKNFRKTAREGGNYLAKSVVKSFDSEQKRTATVDIKKFQEKYKWVKERYKNLTDQAAEQTAAFLLLQELKDIEGSVDKNGNISSGSLIKTGIGKKKEKLYIDISNDLDYNGKEHKVFSFAEKHSAHGGAKVLGSDYNLKGSVQVLDDKIIKQVLLNRGWTDEEIKNAPQILRNPESLSIRNLSGVLSSYIENVFEAISAKYNRQDDFNKDILTKLQGSTLLKDWLVEDNGILRVNKDIFDKVENAEVSEKTLTDFIKDFNKIRRSYFTEGIYKKDVFTVGKDGSLQFNPLNYIGSTSAGIAAQSEYGAPGRDKKNLNVDYRYKGAVDRGTIAASLSTGKNLSLLHKYFLGENRQITNRQGEHVYAPILEETKDGKKFRHAGLLSGDTIDQKNYINWQEQVNEVEKVLNNSILKDTEEIDPIKQLADYVAEGRGIVGYGSIDTFIKNYQEAIINRRLKAAKDDDQKNEIKKQWDKIVKGLTQEGANHYFDLSQEFANWEYDEGLVTKESFQNSLIGQLYAAQKRNEGNLVYVPSNGAFYSNSGNKVLTGNIVEIADIATLNPSLLDENAKSYPVTDVLQGLYGIKRAEEEAASLREQREDHNPDPEAEYTNKEKLTDAIADYFSIMRDTVMNKEGALWQKANKVAIGHSMFGSAVSGPVIDSKDLSDEQNAYLRDINETGIAINKTDLKQLLLRDVGADKEKYFEALKLNYHYLWDDAYKKGYDAVEDKLNEELKNTKETSKKIEFLVDEIVQAVTMGTGAFNKRLGMVQERGGIFRGLNSNLVRFPLSNGLDVQTTELFADKDLDKGSIRAGLGLGKGVNLDFDGDKLNVSLNIANADLAKEIVGDNSPDSTNNSKEFLDQMKSLNDFYRKVNSAIGYIETRSVLDLDTTGKNKKEAKGKLYKRENGSLGVNLSKEELNGLFNEEAQQTSAVLSRINKKFTGINSNNYQAVAEALAMISPHGDNLTPDSEEARQKFVRDMITRGLFEAFTQDAISSKKVVTRITKESIKNGKYGGDWTDNAEFYNELQDLMDTFKQGDTYSSTDRFDRALQKGIKMGIFDKDDMFSSRITARILAVAQQLYTKKDEQGKDVLDEEGYAKALGLTKEDARKRLFQYNDRGQVIGYAYDEINGKKIDSTERGIIKEIVNKSVLEADKELKQTLDWGGIAGAQIRKATYIPGNTNISTAPVAKLGKVTLNQSELNLLKRLNPSIGDLTSNYSDLAEKADVATKALGKEAEAEQNKIGIANTEAKAIAEGTKAYADREKILTKLASRHKDGGDPFVTSESSDLNTIFGNSYLDSEPFRKSVIEAYDKAFTDTNGKLPKDFIITPENLGWSMSGSSTSEQQARFAEFKKGVRSPLQGRITDSLEQVLSELNLGLSEIDGNLTARIKSYDELKNFLDENHTGENADKYRRLQEKIRLSLASGVKGAEGVDYLLGRADYSKLKIDDILPDNDKKEWIVDGQTYTKKEEAFKALQKSNTDNATLFKGLYGDQAERYKRLSTDLGAMTFQGTLGAAKDNLGNVGPKEFKLAYLKDGENRFTQGRIDTIIYDTLKAHTKGFFGDYYDEDKGTISIFDKKLTTSVEAAPRYIAQVLDYINGLKQLQDTTKKIQGGFKEINEEEAIAEIEEFKDTELGNAYSKIFGKDYLQSKNFRGIYQRLRRGDVMRGGLLLTNPQNGQNTQLDFGFSGRDGTFHLTGDTKIDRNILGYLKTGTEFESWDDVTKKRYLEIAKKNTSVGANRGTELAFTRGEIAWADYSDEKEWNNYLNNKKQLLKTDNAIKNLQNLQKNKGLTDAQKEKLKTLLDTQEGLQEAVNSKDKQYKEAIKNLEKEQKQSKSFKDLKKARKGILDRLLENPSELGIDYQDIQNVVKQYNEGKDFLKKTIGQELEKSEGKEYFDISQEVRQELIEPLKEELKKLYERINAFNSTSNNLSTIQKENVSKFLKEENPEGLVGQIIDEVNAEDIKKAEEAQTSIYKVGKEQLALEKERNTLKELLEKHENTLDSEQKLDLESRIKELDNEIKNHIEGQIKEYKDIIGKQNPEAVKKYNSYFKEAQEKNDKQISKLVQERIYQEKKAKEQEYLGLYRGINSRKEDLDILNKRISKTTDPVERKLLEMDRKDAEELLKQAELKIETHKATLSSSENADYLNSIDKNAQLRASLEYQQASEYKEKTRVRTPGLIGMATNSVGNTVAGMGHGFGTYQLLQKFMQTISKVVSSAKALDQTLTNLRIVTSDTKENTRGLVSEYANLANSLGVTTQAVSTSAVEWLRQGYSISESMDLVKSSMYLSTLGMIDSASATQSLTSALKGFKLEATESMDVVDKLTALDLEAATSAGDIAQGLSQFANLGSLAGVNIDEAAAYVATISDVTQMTGSSAGQALKTIISRYGNVKAGSYNKLNVNSDGTDDSTTVNDVENVLKKLGISIRSSTLQFRDFDEVLSEIAEKWDSLDTVSQKAVATSFAGVRQQEAFVTLMQNWDKYESLLETSKNSSGTAEKKYQTYQESLAASLNKLASSWENFANSYEISEVLRFIYESLNTIAEHLPTIVKWLPQIVFAIDDVQAFRGNSIWQKGFRALSENKNIISLSEKWQQDTNSDVDSYSGKFFNTKLGRRINKHRNDKTSKLTRAALNTVLGESYNNLITDEKENVKIVEEDKGPFTVEGVWGAPKKYKVGEYPANLDNNSITTAYSDKSVNAGSYEIPKEEEEEEEFGFTFTPEYQGEEPSFSQKDEYKINEGVSKKDDVNFILIDQEAEITKEKEKQAELAKKETEAKEEVLDAAKKEAENKKEQLQNSEQEKANSNVTAQNSDKEAVNSKKEVINDQTKNNLSKQGVIDAKVKGNYEERGTNEVKEKATIEAGITDNVKNKKGLSGLLSGLGGAGGSALGMAGTAFSLIANSVLSFVTTLQTTGNTHTRIGANGEEESANSSAEAKNAGKWISAGFSLIPVFGTLIGDLVSDKVMAQIDAEKDYAEVTAEKAEDIISVLNSVESDVSTITSTIGSIDSSDLQERMDAVQSLIETLYTSENSDTRSLLETELRNIYGNSSVTLYSVLKDILSSNSEVSEKATKSLEYAQAILEVNQQQLAKASDNYNEREDFKDTVSSLLDSSISTSDVDSIVSSPAKFKRQLQQKQTEYVEKLSQEGISEEEKTKYEATLDKISELLTATDSYISYLQSNIDTYNKNYAAAQLKKATNEKGKYLTNLNISELKAMGASDIYEAYAKAVGAHGLKGIDTYNYYDKNGNIILGKSDKELEEMYKNGTATRELSESFKEAAKTAFKGDEEIWSAVSGSSYTLEGALEALDPNNWADREILQNFADALGTTVENLSQYTDKIGKLKYSEILKSTSELLEEQKNYLDLMTDISDSTKSATEWMNTIINNYPELIGYMSDTPALMEQIMTKIKQLAEYELTTQWSVIANSEAAFRSDDPTANTLVKSMLEWAGDDKDKLESIINKSRASNLNGLITYLKELDKNTEDYKLLYEAISNAGSSYTLTSDAYKSAMQNYISYNSTLLENQINNLTAQKEALQQINSQREYENKLIEAKLALEDAINNKKRVYRAGVGFVYEADQEAISSAEDNLKEVQIEKDVSAIQKQIDTLQKQKDDWDNIWDQRNFELQEEQAIAFAKEFLNQNTIISSGFSSLTLEEQIKAGLIKDITDVVKDDNGTIIGLIGKEGQIYNVITDGNGKITGYFGADGSITSLIDSISTGITGADGVTSKISDVKNALDGLEKTFKEQTQEILNNITGADGTSGTKETQLKDVKDAWEDFKTVRSQYSKGSTQYNDALLNYQKAFNKAKTAGFLTDESDGDDSTSDDWTRKGEDFGSKDSWDAAKEKVENSEAIDEEVKTGSNPYWGKVLLAYNSKMREMQELTPQTYLPTSIPSNVRNDANSAGSWGYTVHRLIDMAGGKPLGNIDSDAKTWRNQTKDWTDLSKIPNGMYASGNGRGTEVFLIYNGNYYQFNKANGDKVFKIGSDQGIIKDHSRWSMIEQEDWEKISYNPYLYKIYGDDDSYWTKSWEKHQKGTYSILQDEQALINEVGTEAIITPNGTLTALPSHTGIVPADITKNLWSLGEVAPSILRVIDNINPNATSKFVNNANNSSVDESVNMPNATFTFNVTDKFDIDDFIDAVQSSAHRRKNLK